MSEAAVVAADGADLTEFLVVLRARSSARFLPEEGFEMNFEPANVGDPPAARLRMFTRWAASGHREPLPRELVIEVRGRAPSLDSAIARFAGLARPMAMMAAFVANVRVGRVEVHLAYDCTPESENRQFVETFLADETGAVSEGRIVRVHLMVAASEALLATDSNRQGRLDRALRQYELALREWCLGGESLALSHLYMAVDALTPAMLKKVMIDRGLTKEELAQSVGIDPYDEDRRAWKHWLEVWCRAEIIFAGDEQTYKAAKTASDGLEHGSLDLLEVHRHALQVTDKTFAYVRRAIVDLLEVSPNVCDELLTIKPRDVQSRRKIIRGRLLGPGEDPAPDEERYPRLEWSSSIGSVLRDGSTFTIGDEDKITVRTRPGIGFQLERLEIIGRLEDGDVPIELDDQDVKIVTSAGSRPKELLALVMPIVDAATATGVDVGQVFPRMLAFNLFGQATAFFQSAQTLIDTFQPAEALLPLRGLVTIAAHFEEMTKPGGAGVGLAARLAIDSLSRDYIEEEAAGQDLRDKAMARQQQWIDAAARLSVEMPEVVPSPEASEVWKSLAGEMRLARQVAEVSYATISLHLQPGEEPDRMAFRTKLEPDRLTDMVATAAAIAELDLVKRSAQVFGWTIDSTHIDNLLAESRALNEIAASPEVEPTGQGA